MRRDEHHGFTETFSEHTKQTSITNHEACVVFVFTVWTKPSLQNLFIYYIYTEPLFLTFMLRLIHIKQALLETWFNVSQCIQSDAWCFHTSLPLLQSPFLSESFLHATCFSKCALATLNQKYLTFRKLAQTDMKIKQRKSYVYEAYG